MLSAASGLSASTPVGIAVHVDDLIGGVGAQRAKGDEDTPGLSGVFESGGVGVRADGVARMAHEVATPADGRSAKGLHGEMSADHPFLVKADLVRRASARSRQCSW